MAHSAPQRPRFVAAIDQGTSSTRFMLYDEKVMAATLLRVLPPLQGQMQHSSQREFELITPKPGYELFCWVT